MNPTPPAEPSPVRPLLVMRGVRKCFDGNEVLKGVDFDVRPGEVHALVSENGAGKSTLMNILAGVHQPSTGTIEFNGHTGVVMPDEKSAQQLGISIVFQERSLFGHLSVAENIFAARPPNLLGHILRKKLQAEARHSLERIKLDVDPGTLVEELSPAQPQMIEVAKALSLEAKVIIFDEPTSALTDKETQALFAVIR